MEYSIFDLGFNKNLTRESTGSIEDASLPNLSKPIGVGSYTGGLSNFIETSFNPQNIGSGAMVAVLFSGKKTFSDTTSGYRMGVDTDGVYKWIIGGSSSSVDWAVTTADTLTITGAGLVSPIIRYGKTSFSDSTNAGYYLSSEGVYVGAASDTTFLKYTVASGLFDFVGTISSRATSVIASAINSGGNLITEVINAKLDTSTKKILSDFNFGTSDYAGGVKAGDITWNTSTGAITGGSGIVVYRSGIIGASGGVATFSIDATTGSATFAGTLSAASGTLGALTITSGGNIKSGQTAYDDGTGFYLGNDSGTSKFSIGNSAGNKLTWNGTTLSITGTLSTPSGTVLDITSMFGDGSDGALSISSGTTTLNTANKTIYQYTSVSITGTAVLTGGANLQNKFTLILVQGDLTITSSATAAVDWKGLGGPGGAGGAVGAAGTAGTAGSTVRTSNGGGAGSPNQGGGGGGGGYGNAGTVGATGNGGAGGSSNSYDSTFTLVRILSDMFLGGGAGGGGGGLAAGAGGDGGNGGGSILFLVKGNINITGTLRSSGNDGSNADAGDGTTGSGGGGGGGFIGVYYLGSVTADSGTYTVAGGAGGTTNNDGGAGGAGQAIRRKISSSIGV